MSEDQIIEPEITEDLEKGGYSKCTRCGKPSHGKSRCQACLNKLSSKRKKPGTKERSWQHADQALRRDRGGAGTTSGGHATGKGNRQQIQRKMKAAEKKTGEKLSLDRTNNDRGYEAKNTRAVPQSLNRGRHHVDPKKLRAWKKRLKKSEIDADALYTLMKAKYANEPEVMELLKSVGPDGLESYIDIFDIDELEKSAAPKLQPEAQTAPSLPAIHSEIGKVHTVEVHPDLDHLYRAKGLINENHRKHLHIGDYKKANFPGDIIKKLPRDAYGKVTPEMIDKHIEGLPKTKMNIKVQPYTWGSQQHRKYDTSHPDQYALEVHMHPESKIKMSPEVQSLWNAINDKQHNLAPEKTENHLSTQIGWSRVDPHKMEGDKATQHNHWHLDEIQSDFQNKDKINSKLHHTVPELHLNNARNQALQEWAKRSEPFDDDDLPEVKSHPAYKKLSELSNEAQSQWEKRDFRAHDDATEKFYAEAVKHGIVKPKEHYLKEVNDKNEAISKHKEKAGELLSHLSHGHEDPQHLVHSATNALARKLGVKSMSMDTPEDQATQSSLRTGAGNNHRQDDYDYDRWSNDIDNYLGDNFTQDHFDEAAENHPNPNLRSAFKKIGYEKINNAYSEAIGSSDPSDYVLDHMSDDDYKKLSIPEKDAIQEHISDLASSGPDIDNYTIDRPADNEEDSGDEEPLDLSKLPVHQIDTYHKRPRKLGMKEVDKSKILGTHPNDEAETVQYMNLHKRLQSILEALRKAKTK